MSGDGVLVLLLLLFKVIRLGGGHSGLFWGRKVDGGDGRRKASWDARSREGIARDGRERHRRLSRSRTNDGRGKGDVELAEIDRGDTKLAARHRLELGLNGVCRRLRRAFVILLGPDIRRHRSREGWRGSRGTCQRRAASPRDGGSCDLIAAHRGEEGWPGGSSRRRQGRGLRGLRG